MSANTRFKGPRGQRFFIVVLSIILAILLFWLLNFLTNDIGSLRGPDFDRIKVKHIDNELVQKQKLLEEKLDVIKKNNRNQREQRNILKDSTDNLQNTINQLLSIQKQRVVKDSEFSAENQQTLTESQKVFLENQKRYQNYNQAIAELTRQQRALEKELASISKQINEQEKLARDDHNKLMRRHRLKVAVLKLAVVLPIFLITAWFFVKKRSGLYGSIVYATFIAVFLKLSLIVHEHFPSEYFKYIALLVIIGIVLKLLLYMLKRIISPKESWLLSQYQESYDKAVCPVCGKPVRMGPLRYAISGKRREHVLTNQGTDPDKQYSYTCPSCGTALYEKCDKCTDIRHSLLPFCEHCGSEKKIEKQTQAAKSE